MNRDAHAASHGLSEAQIEQFIRDGFVRVDAAFSTEVAAEARELLWRDTGCDPNDRSTWTKPVVRLWDYPREPFRQVANTLVLHQAYDALVGKDRWIPPERLGSVPVRFPHRDDPGDTGWHVDASFPPDPPVGDDYMRWRINVDSKGRALLMLFLFSDVGADDAPTRIRIGSHLTVAKVLAPAGEYGLSTMELARKAVPATTGLKETVATGSAGTVYLCHPFLVHAAQPHRGEAPRFLAQPALLPRVPFQITRTDADYSPVEKAIRLGLGQDSPG